MLNEERRFPCARRERLIVRELPDEVLVYDLDRDQAHCLNRTAAEVWKQCDGHATPADIARRLGRLDERIVWLALDQLSQHHLLKQKVDWPATMSRMSRREAVRRLGIGAAIAIPLISSIIAPTPAQAVSCFPTCHPCNTGSDCCSGVCVSNPSGCQSGTTRCT